MIGVLISGPGRSCGLANTRLFSFQVGDERVLTEGLFNVFICFQWRQ
jgi:hypothetical protein